MYMQIRFFVFIRVCNGIFVFIQHSEYARVLENETLKLHPEHTRASMPFYVKTPGMLTGTAIQSRVGCRDYVSSIGVAALRTELQPHVDARWLELLSVASSSIDLRLTALRNELQAPSVVHEKLEDFVHRFCLSPPLPPPSPSSTLYTPTPARPVANTDTPGTRNHRTAAAAAAATSTTKTTITRQHHARAHKHAHTHGAHTHASGRSCDARSAARFCRCSRCFVWRDTRE